MFNPIYKVRAPLPTDKKRFVFDVTPHLVVIGAAGVRVLLKRYGPLMWRSLMRPVLIKYRLKALLLKQ